MKKEKKAAVSGWDNPAAEKAPVLVDEVSFTIRRRKDGTTEIVIGIFRQHAKGTAHKPQTKFVLSLQ